MPTSRRPTLTPYSSALLDAMVRRAHGQTTREQYLRECEHAAAVHDRMEERRRFAEMMESDSEPEAPDA